jgi:hypothetical protein
MPDVNFEMVVERWRASRDDALADQTWVALHAKCDKERQKARTEILDLLKGLLSESISVQEFRSTYHLKACNEWDAFGLKGFAGAMFLNQLDKHIPDKKALSNALRVVLPLPSDENDAKKRIHEFVTFQNKSIAKYKIGKRQLVPGLTPFFISSWWHMQDMEAWPIFYPTARKALLSEGLFEPSSDYIVDYFAFREIFLALAKALDLCTWDFEHLCRWQVDSLPRPPKEPLVIPVSQETEDEFSTSHTHVQYVLAAIGHAMGCKVWIASNDRKKTWDGHRLGEMSLPELPNLGLDKESQDLIRLIDVLWLKGSKQVAAAFEIECTTSIYSGLLRLSDLVTLSPNLSFPLYVIVPESRLDKVRKELGRPTFEALDLGSRCGFFSDKRLFQEAESMIAWATDPSAIAKLVEKG